VKTSAEAVWVSDIGRDFIIDPVTA
jgi:hypothetical protein